MRFWEVVQESESEIQAQPSWARYIRFLGSVSIMQLPLTLICDVHILEDLCVEFRISGAKIEFNSASILFTEDVAIADVDFPGEFLGP